MLQWQDNPQNEVKYYLFLSMSGSDGQAPQVVIVGGKTGGCILNVSA